MASVIEEKIKAKLEQHVFRLFSNTFQLSIVTAAVSGTERDLVEMGLKYILNLKETTALLPHILATAVWVRGCRTQIIIPLQIFLRVTREYTG